MAVKQMVPKGDEDKINCPKCGEKALIIEGRFIRWLTCPNCKYKKLLEKRDDAQKVRIVSLK